MTNEKEIQFQIEGNASDVIELLVQLDGFDFEKALDVFYSSKTFQKLERPETGLFFQSPEYIHEILLKELK